MSHGRSCIGGVHVFRMAYLTIYCVLLEDMSYWRHVFLYWRACFVVRDILHFTGGYIL